MRLWDHLCIPLLASLPPLAETSQWTEERLMMAVNRAMLNTWVYSEGAKVLAVLTTTVTGDELSNTRALLIYTANSEGELSIEDWQLIYRALSAHASKARCTSIVAFSAVDRVIDIFNELGGDTSQVLCRLPLSEG